MADEDTAKKLAVKASNSPTKLPEDIGQVQPVVSSSVIHSLEAQQQLGIYRPISQLDQETKSMTMLRNSSENKRDIQEINETMQKIEEATQETNAKADEPNLPKVNVPNVQKADVPNVQKADVPNVQKADEPNFRKPDDRIIQKQDTLPLAKKSTVIPAKSSKSRAGRSPTNINHLPNRILAKIIEFLPDKEYQSLKEVSPHWNSLIDRHIGIPITLGKSSQFLEASDNFEFGTPSTIAEYGISSCYFSNIHHIQIPAFKYPNLVREVTFLDYVSEGCFRRILGPLSNLRYLGLDLSSIHYLEFKNISLDFLPRLDFLQIFNGEYSSIWNDEVHPSRNEVQITLDNTYSLLQDSHIPNLKVLMIDFPICFPMIRNGDFLVAIFRCLLNHAQTIKTLEIYFEGELKSLEDDEIEIPTGVLAEFDVDQLSAVKLQNFMINLQKEHQAQNLVSPWLGLLSTQTELRRCSFLPRNTDDDDVVELPLPTSVILTNATTLVAFKWFLDEDWSSNVPAPINCDVFETCIQLEDLHLAATGNISSTLSNVWSLPSSIRAICIEGIHIDKSDVELIVTSLPNLQKLSLASIGQVNGCGMTISTLKGIFDRKTLRRLVINYGFNLESLRLAPAENNAFSFILMLVKNKFADEDDSYFHMQLCENGLEYAVKQ